MSSPVTPTPMSVCHLLIEVFVDDWLVLDALSTAGKLHGRQSLDHAFQGRADHRHHRGLAVTSEAFFLGGGEGTGGEEATRYDSVFVIFL